MNNPELIVDVIRHGEPLGGARYRGYGIDDPLSEKGWQQMWDAVGEASPWQHIVTSPLARCLEFAERLGERNGVPVTSVDDFREVGFGSWEGKTKAELIEWDAEAFEAFYRDPVAHRPPGAEPLEHFLKRVQNAFSRVVDAEQSEQMLVVAHAGVIRAILAGVLHLDAAAMYRVIVKNAGIMRLIYRKETPNLEWLNGRLG